VKLWHKKPEWTSVEPVTARSHFRDATEDSLQLNKSLLDDWTELWVAGRPPDIPKVSEALTKVTLLQSPGDSSTRIEGVAPSLADGSKCDYKLMWIEPELIGEEGEDLELRTCVFMSVFKFRILYRTVLMGSVVEGTELTGYPEAFKETKTGKIKSLLRQLSTKGRKKSQCNVVWP
jgi:hypothetical protein